MVIESNIHLIARSGMRQALRRFDEAAETVTRATESGPERPMDVTLETTGSYELPGAIVNMMEAQRAFSANRSVARISNEIVRELIRIAEKNSVAGG